MADDFAEFDDDDFLVEDEEESSNRPFILAVMGLVGVLLVSAVILGLYLTFAGGPAEPTATEVANEVNAEQAATATHISATNEAVQTQNAYVTQTLESRRMTDEAPAEATLEPEPEVTEEPDEVAAAIDDAAGDEAGEGGAEGDAAGEEAMDSEAGAEGDAAAADASEDAAMDESGDAAMDESGDAAMDESGDAAMDESGEAAMDESGEAAMDASGEGDADAEPNAAATSIFNDVSTVTPEAVAMADSGTDGDTAAGSDSTTGADSDQGADVLSSDSDASAVVGGSSTGTGTEAVDASQEFATLPETGLFSTLIGSIGAAMALLLAFVGARRLRRED